MLMRDNKKLDAIKSNINSYLHVSELSVTNSHIRTIDNYSMGTILLRHLPEKTQKYLKTFLQTTSAGVTYDYKVPKYFDLRKQYGDKISIPLDQGSCGSCWAFATCSSLQDRVAMFINDNFWKQWTYIPYTYGNNKTIKVKDFLSPYFLAGCDYCEEAKNNKSLYDIMVNNTECNEQCSGGVILYAMIFAGKVGLISHLCNSTSFSYECHTLKTIPQTKASKGNCYIYYFDDPYEVNRYSDSSLNEINKDKYKNIFQENELQLMAEIYNKGPVPTGMMVYDDFPQFNFKPSKNINEEYKKFDSKYVYTKHSNTFVGGHAVSIIGWGECSDGIKYWICRNSWSIDWGDNGFFRILKGINFCGIESNIFVCNPNFNKINEQISSDPTFAYLFKNS